MDIDSIEMLTCNSGGQAIGPRDENLKASDNPIIEVHCAYNHAQKMPMSSLKESQVVTIRGVCEGKLSTMIILKNSVLVD